MYIKKITVKTVCGEFDPPGKDSSPLALMTIGGVCTSITPKQTDYGQSWRFAGQFVAFDAATGEKFESAVAYLPDVVADPLAAALEATHQPVEFAVKILVKYDKGVATRYSYTAETIEEVSKSPALLRLEARMAESLVPPAKQAEEAAHAVEADTAVAVAVEKPKVSK